MLKIKKLRVSVEGKEILRGINLEIMGGEVVAIMGPNGSGKSTLAYALAGHPKYVIDDGSVKLDESMLLDKSPDERANFGLFLAMQYPMAIPGLSVRSFLWQLYKKRNIKNEFGSILKFKVWLESQSKNLGLKLELLERNLNDGFSGGEKKKFEILQMLVFNPKYVILDEIDSGLDVDALRKIAQTVSKVAKERGLGVIVITHYNRILKYLEPDKVVVIEAGKIVRSGDKKLAMEIETKGYKSTK